MGTQFIGRSGFDKSSAIPVMAHHMALAIAESRACPAPLSSLSVEELAHIVVVPGTVDHESGSLGILVSALGIVHAAVSGLAAGKHLVRCRLAAGAQPERDNRQADVKCSHDTLEVFLDRPRAPRPSPKDLDQPA